jgi:alkylation response protein AidB-like acyl-CoA dehydrogenase
MQVALDYANAREVFGQVLTKYQVTRHKAVDLLREVELAKVGVHYAAWASDADAPDREDAVAMAKSYAAEAANHVGAECIQIHGGVGFTWDCDAHLYLRRAKVNDLLLGAQSWQRERLADSYFASL